MIRDLGFSQFTSATSQMDVLRSTKELIVLYQSIRRHISENSKFQMLHWVKYTPTPCPGNIVYLYRIQTANYFL
jgi:hypothetical protein